MSDYISRQAAIDALARTAREMFNLSDEFNYYLAGLMDGEMAIRQLPSAQPDLEEYSVWFYIGETLVDVSKMHITAEEGIEKIRSYLTRMKKPERKTGKWIYDEERGATGIYAICSACDESIYQTGDFKFCPNCGGYMTKGEKEV